MLCRPAEDTGIVPRHSENPDTVRILAMLPADPPVFMLPKELEEGF
jgi:hypothetical protein